MVTINVRRSTMVRPAEPTPRHRLLLSNLDLVAWQEHTTFMYFYRADGSTDFFDAVRMRDALAQVLVSFYPIAGRLAIDEKGRIEIDCDGQGAQFIEADSDAIMENDLGGFAPTKELRQLTPEVDYSGGISAYPLLSLQVTSFKCGGVSLGFAVKHLLADGFTIVHFINSWSHVARGAAGHIFVAPFIDRTLLLARNPPTPCFPHVEYNPPPYMDYSSGLGVAPHMNSSDSCVGMFKLTREHLNTLKKSCHPGAAAYSTFVVLAAHVWRCACAARELPANQMTKLYIATNGRRRLLPPLPKGYFGNVLFAASSLARAGELTAADGYAQAVTRIHATLSTMTNEYLRSALDFQEMQLNLEALAPWPHLHRCPNLRLVSWMGLPLHDADFGWGRPMLMVPGWIPDEGIGFVLPSPARDGSVSLIICLQTEHMARFQKLTYHISPPGNFTFPSKL